jgi:2-dehydro-3-deoxygluconokinase
MKKIHFLGECMVELRSTQPNTMQQSFAGDVYNSSVYLKRCFPDIHSGLITSIGEDSLSTKMLGVFSNEKIITDFVFRHPTKVAGMYLIETDEFGERSFIYWRSDAAARKVVEFLDDDVLEKLAESDMFFVSGISLAVLEPTTRSSFWDKVSFLKNRGVKIVFDPNYRPRLWVNEDEARDQFDQAFALADITLPGVEDLSDLYQIQNSQELVEFCKAKNISEVIVKDGPASVVSYDGQRTTSHQITPVERVVDTTSAGDAFNGAYLGARLSGYDIEKAVRYAALAAGIVIQHRGAIAPKMAFDTAFKHGVEAL